MSHASTITTTAGVIFCSDRAVRGMGHFDLRTRLRMLSFATEREYFRMSRICQGCTIPGMPWEFKAHSDVLLINAGDGTFTDASLQAGVQSVDSLPGLAVATLDSDDDGDLDIYVANDSVPNHLWINDGPRPVRRQRSCSRSIEGTWTRHSVSAARSVADPAGRTIQRFVGRRW